MPRGPADTAAAARGPCPLFLAFSLVLLLFEVNLTEARTGGSRSQPPTGQRALLRPLPSHDLPVIDLVEPSGHVYDPGPEDLDVAKLQRTLAGHFDPKFMSIRRPKESLLHPNGSLQPGFRLKKGRLVPARPMPKELQRLRLKGIDLPGGLKVKLDLGRRLRRKIRQLLWTYTYCPLVYRWKDLGLRFWPRWIREGRCYNGRRSCSFPPGMSCREKTSAEKTVLRWHCRDWTERRQCRWIPATLSVLVECSCSC